MSNVLGSASIRNIEYLIVVIFSIEYADVTEKTLKQTFKIRHIHVHELPNTLKASFYVLDFSNTQPHKAELLQLNRTQIPSLGIFVCKKVGNRKK